VELEGKGKAMLVEGIKLRGQAYFDYLEEGHTQKEAAEFFGLAQSKISEYVKVYHYIIQSSDKVNQIENVSMNKLLKELVDPEKREKREAKKAEKIADVAVNVNVDDVADDYIDVDDVDDDYIDVEHTSIDYKAMYEKLQVVCEKLEVEFDDLEDKYIEVKKELDDLEAKAKGANTSSDEETLTVEEIKECIKMAGSGIKLAKALDVSSATISKMSSGRKMGEAMKKLIEWRKAHQN
jgi:predicted transcriptional regulator